MIDEFELYSMHLTYDYEGPNAIVILLLEIHSIIVIFVNNPKTQKNHLV